MDKDTVWYKKWWVWVLVVIVVLFVIGLVVNQNGKNVTDNDEQTTETEVVETEEGNNSNASETNTENELTEAERSNTLPEVKPSDYIGQEILVVYHDLANQGYEIDLDYANKDNEKLYEANMSQIETIKNLDPNNIEDRQSVDAYKVYNVVQLGDHLTIIAK